MGQLLRSLTWRVLSMIIGQVSLAAFGAHLVHAGQMNEILGGIIGAGVVVLAIIGGLGEAGARQIVAGVRAWRKPEDPPPPAA